MIEHPGKSTRVETNVHLQSGQKGDKLSRDCSVRWNAWAANWSQLLQPERQCWTKSVSSKQCENSLPRGSAPHLWLFWHWVRDRAVSVKSTLGIKRLFWMLLNKRSFALNHNDFTGKAQLRGDDTSTSYLIVLCAGLLVVIGWPGRCASRRAVCSAVCLDQRLQYMHETLNECFQACVRYLQTSIRLLERSLLRTYPVRSSNRELTWPLISVHQQVSRRRFLLPWNVNIFSLCPETYQKIVRATLDTETSGTAPSFFLYRTFLPLSNDPTVPITPHTLNITLTLVTTFSIRSGVARAVYRLHCT